jgi:hypothetical protein
MRRRLFQGTFPGRSDGCFSLCMVVSVVQVGNDGLGEILRIR